MLMHVALFWGPIALHKWVQRDSKAMHVLNFTIAFAFETKLGGGNRHNLEIIVVTSE